MTGQTPNTIYLKDYQAPPFAISETDLVFDLFDEYALVTCTLMVERVGEHQSPLVLHGQDLELQDIALDGETLAVDLYQVTEEFLSISVVPDRFSLTTVCKIYPQKNTSLEGLYLSRTMFCTQCEAEGFRKITYYLDRPDVLSVFTTKIIASEQAYPTLLSNGNCVAEGKVDDQRHWKQWHDPFPKPSYLFAVVAGDLKYIQDTFTTQSGKEVDLRIYVEEKDLDKCDHAMASLKNAMVWDEKVYGREYDLDIFMIVAVDDFNMGAMENKGLNIFNTSCVLAHSATTTDLGFQRVEAVVAHEYFHNWSGNRVTCRDWFQLSLKEGFTVFRDAEFSADMGSRTVKRVEDVQLLRSAQFVEDAGPMAHPVRPEYFIEISNFYTLTVYEKGAEVVRMIRTIIGEDAFRKGSDLYFERHDGQAATVEDFINAMADASGRDFSQFMNWYRQAGTPQVSVVQRYDEETQQLSLTLSQRCPSTPEAKSEEKMPFVIPVAVGLLGGQGSLPLNIEDATSLDPHTVVLELDETEKTFVFNGVTEDPTVSLFRGFSAPVKLTWDRDIKDLQRIMTMDPDGFSRWDATQELAKQAIFGVNFPTNHALLALQDALRDSLRDESLDPAMVALMLDLPSEAYLCELQDPMDIDGVLQARQLVKEVLAENLKPILLEQYRRCQSALEGKSSDVSAASVALRSLQNKALEYLALLEEDVILTMALNQFERAANMTEEFAALKSVVQSPVCGYGAHKDKMLSQFFQRWSDEALVVNQWFAVQASDPSEGALERVKLLMQHPSYDGKNPNKIRSVIGVFANQNLKHFHQADGSGYVFLADQILALNKQNPQIAARLVAPLSKWRRLDQSRSELMQSQLQRIQSEKGLSKDVFEVVSKSLTETL